MMSSILSNTKISSEHLLSANLTTREYVFVLPNAKNNPTKLTAFTVSRFNCRTEQHVHGRRTKRVRAKRCEGHDVNVVLIHHTKLCFVRHRIIR